MRQEYHRVDSLEASTNELNFFTCCLENSHLGRMDRVGIKSSANGGANF